MNTFIRKHAGIGLGALLALGTTVAMSAQTQQSTQDPEKSSKPELMVASTDHSRMMDGLLESTSKLRESIQTLAQQPDGPKRDAAIKAARAALLDAQRAMLALPADLRVESKERREASAWPKAMARLDEAAEKLHESAQAMSKLPADQRPSAAIEKARESLEETQQAMLALPDYKTN